MLDTKRREFLALLSAGGLLLAVKVRRARAQQPVMPVIGFLDTRAPDAMTARLRVFRQSLKEAGFVEGQNVEIEVRSAEDQVNRLQALVADLIRRPVSSTNLKLALHSK
jgi:putative tryptophan/tyrosine transport system substrate-binding protein